MKNNDNIQAKASSGEIHNKTAFPGDITSVAITHSGTARATTILGSSDGTNWTQVATGSGSITGDFSGKGYKYFKITRGSNAAYWTKIVISYGSSSTPTVNSPVFSPAAGVVAYGTTVTLTQPNAYMINYTINGSDPTWDNGKDIDSNPITITNDVTIKARAYDRDQNASAIVTAAYTVERPAAPTFSPAAGAVEAGTQVTISGTGRIIVYTTDGSTPSYGGDPGEVYTDPITVNEAMTIKAIVVDSHDFESEVATASYTIYDPNAPGTQNNPYTVAQARAAIDAGTGKTGVYATGIVSAIPTAYSTQYSNITFNFVDEEGDTEFLQAYRCVGDKAANVQVGDIVVVSGDLTKYGSTYEFGQGCQLVSLTHPSIPVISANNVELAYDATSGEIAYTINNPVAGANLSATTTADWVSGIAVTADKVTFTTTANEGDEDRIATFILSYEGATNKTVTVTQKHFVADYATLPFAYDGNGTGDLPQGFTVSGLGTYNSSPAMKFDGTGDYAILKINERPGKLTFDIKGNTFSGGTFKVQTSVDGTTFTDLESYTELGDTQSESVDNLAADIRYIKWIYTNKSSGNVALGNIQLAQYVEPSHDPTITLTPLDINVDAEEHDGTIAISLENLTVEDKSEFGIQYWNGGDPVESLDWITVEIAEQDPQVGEGYVVSYIVAANDGPTRNAAFKLYVESDEEPVYSDLVTITQAAYVAPFEPATYTLANSITSGKHYIIVGESTTSSYAMGVQNSNNRAAVEITISDETATVNSADVHEVQICGPDADGYYTIYDNGYLYAASSSNNYLRTETTLDNNGRWSIAFGEGGVASIIAQGENSHNQMRFNASGSLFSCYASGQQPVYLYEKDGEATPTQTVSISSAGMATFCSENALDFTGLTDMYAYIALYNNDKVTYRKVTKVPARTGVMLRNPNGDATSQEVPVLTGAADDVEGNKFIGTLTEISSLPSVDNDNTNYILNNGENGVGFYKAAGKKVGAGKAYLQIPTPADAKVFIGFEETGEATGIENVNRETTTNGRCYNLNGQQVSGNYKGIVIVNGKKTIVK